MIKPKKIIISRTDSIGDVVLTLPMAGVLKRALPGVQIIFLGRNYTKAIIEPSVFVDEFVSWDEIEKLNFDEQKKKFAALNADCIVHVFPNSAIAKLAAASGIRYRIGTTNRLYHWLYCNKLVAVGRKNSNLHEAQLNLKLLNPIIGRKDFSLEEIPGYYGLTKTESLLHVPVKSPARDLTDSNASSLSMPLSPQASREKRDAALAQGRLSGNESDVPVKSPARDLTDSNASSLSMPLSPQASREKRDAALAQGRLSGDAKREDASPLFDKSKFNLILHPKSKGSGREWSLENFSALIKLLPEESFKIFISGTKEDGETLKDFLAKHKNEATDITGQMNLPAFISFIKNADGLIAASTGPLHIAAALGIYALGIYAPMRPIFPQRWAPLGDKATYLVKDTICNDCQKNMQCHCMNEVTPEQVFEGVRGWHR